MAIGSAKIGIVVIKGFLVDNQAQITQILTNLCIGGPRLTDYENPSC